MKTDEGDYEYTYLDEHWVLHRIVESGYRTPETNLTLYVNYTRIKKQQTCPIHTVNIWRYHNYPPIQLGYRTGIVFFNFLNHFLNSHHLFQQCWIKYINTAGQYHFTGCLTVGVIQQASHSWRRVPFLIAMHQEP